MAEGHYTPTPSDACLPQQELPHRSDVANYEVVAEVSNQFGGRENKLVAAGKPSH